MADPKALFPIPLAIRLLLDSVAYSNALPDWAEPLVIDYNRREDRIAQVLERYLAGDKPIRPLEVLVPKKSGKPNLWLVPSINDQIVLQACVSAIAQTVERKCVDRAIVFSCRLNEDPKRLAFLENQVDAWKRFQLVVEERCSTDQCVLQIDLKSAFESIRLDAFQRFLANTTDNHPAAKVLNGLLGAFSGSTSGLPFINNSIFFLGNAYLSEVDKIVRSLKLEFVRFVDDYRIFGRSTSDLEAALAKLRQELKSKGFEINDQKLKLGTGEEYLSAVAELKYAETPETQYRDGSVHRDLFAPDGLFAQVLECLRNPEEKLHEGSVEC